MKVGAVHPEMGYGLATNHLYGDTLSNDSHYHNISHIDCLQTDYSGAGSAPFVPPYSISATVLDKVSEDKIVSLSLHSKLLPFT